VVLYRLKEEHLLNSLFLILYKPILKEVYLFHFHWKFGANRHLGVSNNESPIISQDQVFIDAKY